MKNIIEYYTLGSQSEMQGMTLMTRTLNEEGEPVVQFGEPDKWYKPNQITEEEYNDLKAQIESADPNDIGIAGGLLNDEGKAVLAAENAACLETVNRDAHEMCGMQKSIMDDMIDKGILRKRDILRYISNQQAGMLFRKKLRGEFEGDYSSLTRAEKASVWAILNASSEELLNGGRIETGTKFDDGTTITAGDMGKINEAGRKLTVLQWFNVAENYNDQMTEEEIVNQIMNDRSNLLFVGK